MVEQRSVEVSREESREVCREVIREESIERSISGSIRLIVGCLKARSFLCFLTGFALMGKHECAFPYFRRVFEQD
jgi:hypothetical protein